MNDILLGVTLVSIAGMFILRLLLIKAKKKNEENEDFIRLVRKIHHIDDMISRFKRDDPNNWAKDHRARAIIAKRVELYEEYCTFVAGHPIREVEYVNGLMDAAVRPGSA